MADEDFGAPGGGAAAAPAAVAVPTARDFLPFVEKYRPTSLDDLVSQSHIVTTINRLIDANRLPHLLFYGPPGTGKTTTILALAQRLYGPAFSSMTLMLNASDDRGIDVVRDQIKNFAGTRKLFSTGVKLVILDEADAMTNDAQFALRRVIEKYVKNTRFCLICNYVSKIIPALQSRCTRFRFAPLARTAMESRLRYVVEKEGLVGRVSDGAVRAILTLSGGDMRKVLNVLQAAVSGYDAVDEDTIYAVTGNPRPAEVEAVLNQLLTADFKAVYEYLQGVLTSGHALGDLVTEVSRLVIVLGLDPDIRGHLLEKLADIEYRLSFGTSEKLQGAAFVGAFVQAREMLMLRKPKA